MSDHARIEALERQLLSLQQSLETVKGELAEAQRANADWLRDITAEIEERKQVAEELETVKGEREQVRALIKKWRDEAERRRIKASGWAESQAFQSARWDAGMSEVYNVCARDLESALLRERPQEPTKDIWARTGEASTAMGGAATASTDTKG